MFYFLITIPVAAFLCVLGYIVLPWAVGQFLRRKLRFYTQENRAICLTFDDGPSDRLTPQILDILKEHNIKAAFFLLGRNIPGREAIVRRIAAEGHQIGSHGYDHLFAWKAWPWQVIADIQKSWCSIDQAMGQRQKVYPFRPPYGKLNLASLLYLWYKKVPICYWTIDSEDTWQASSRASTRVITKVAQHKSGVVLLHDFERASSNGREYVFGVIQSIINIAKEDDLNVTAFSDLKE